MEKKVYELTISEMLEHVMPPLQEVELDLLTQSLLSEGCRDPLVVWNGIIVDGHNRYRICQENNIPFTYEDRDFEDEAAAKRWIIDNQLGRRNLPDFVKCELVLPIEAELKAEAKKRQGRRNDLKNIPPNLAGSSDQGDSRDSLAKIAGVSHGTLNKAKTLMKEADDETLEKLRKGKVSIHGAYTALKDSPVKSDMPPQTGSDEEAPWGTDSEKGEKQTAPSPGYGLVNDPAPTPESAKEILPESVYGKPPVTTFGMLPDDDTDFRAKAEMLRAESDVRTATEHYTRRVGEILRFMTEASITDKNIATLKGIITDGYDQIMKLMKLGGTEND